MCTLLRGTFPPEEISFLSRLKEGGKEWGKVHRDELKVTVANSFSCPKKSFLSQLVYYGTQPYISSGYNQIQLSLTPFALYYVVAPPALAKKRPSLQVSWWSEFLFFFPTCFAPRVPRLEWSGSGEQESSQLAHVTVTPD